MLTYHLLHKSETLSSNPIHQVFKGEMWLCPSIHISSRNGRFFTHLVVKMIFLPQYLEELDPIYLDPKSNFFLGKEQLSKRPKIKDLIGKLNLHQSSELVRYMEAGQIVFAWMGTVHDPLDPKKSVYTSDYSDGIYVWRDMHIYLVKNYKLDLPRDFKNHVNSYRGSVEHMKMLDQKKLIDQIKLSTSSISKTIPS